MTEGSNAARRADTRPGMIELTFIHADLAAAIARIGVLARLSVSEHDFMARQHDAGRETVLNRWRQGNLLLQEAMTGVEQAHARLDAAARYVFEVVGNAEDRATEDAVSRT